MTNPLALVIEDDNKLANIFSLSLQAARFEVDVVQDGQSAIARLEAVIPAVVVLDLHLPNVSGKDILRHIRADERLAETKVILATADARMAETLRRESDLVLLKPISPNQMRDLAARLRPPGMPDI